MFNQGSTYSLSDIAAVSGRGNGGWGDENGAWWIIILLLAFAGWGNGGFGGNGGGTSTREEIAYGFDMNGLENGVRGIQQGLCDGFYAVNTGMLNGFNGVQSALCQGFSGVNDAITQSTIADMQSDFALQTALSGNTNTLMAQLTAMAANDAACCCATQREIEKGFCDTGRAIADSTRDIIDSNNAGVRSILDFLTQDKIATLTAENQTLKFAASQQAQNAYLVNELGCKCPVPAYVVPNPYGYALNACGC